MIKAVIVLVLLAFISLLIPWINKLMGKKEFSHDWWEKDE